MADKISRKELKEPDLVVSFTQNALVWLEQRKAVLIGLGLGVVVVVVAIYGWGWYVENSTQKASKSFIEARKIMDARVVKNDDAADTSMSDGSYPSEQSKYEAALSNFEAVRKAHGNSATATLALFYIGECHSRLGDYDKAVSSFEAYLSAAGPSGELAAFAVEGIAASLEEKGEIDKAKQHFKRLTEEPFATERPRGLYHLARLEQKHGDKTEAAKQFKKLVNEFPQTSYQREIQERLSVLPEVEIELPEAKPEKGADEAADDSKNG